MPCISTMGFAVSASYNSPGSLSFDAHKLLKAPHRDSSGVPVLMQESRGEYAGSFLRHASSQPWKFTADFPDYPAPLLWQPSVTTFHRTPAPPQEPRQISADLGRVKATSGAFEN